MTINNKKKIPLDQQFFWYNGNGINCTLDRTVASGVYAFNPLKDAALRMNLETKNITVYKGTIILGATEMPHIYIYNLRNLL